MRRYKRYLEVDNDDLIPRRSKYRHRMLEAERNNPERNSESCGESSYGNHSNLGEDSASSYDTEEPIINLLETNNNSEIDNSAVQSNNIDIENDDLGTFNTDSEVCDDGIDSNNADDEIDPNNTDDDADCEDNISSESDGIFDEHEPDGDPYLAEPLCDFLDCTRGEVLLMVMTMGLRHLLSWEAMVDMLKMINAIFNNKVVPASKYFLHKYFPPNIQTIYHIYCPECQRYLGTRNAMENDVHCDCGQNMNVKDLQSYFIQFDVREQLHHFLKDPKFVNNLNYRFTRIKVNETAIEDVFDGKMYKKNELLKNNLNMSYTFNTDGCQAADSSKITIWPIFMMLHDLPPHERKKYMILAGLWVDKIEPNMNIFLEAFVNQANDLSSVGITWNLGNRNVTSKLIPLVCSVDTPARCKMLYMKQYNGHFGCTFCLHPTHSVNRSRKYTISPEVPPLRTDASIKLAMIEASDLGQLRNNIDGIWGPSSLMNLKHFDLAKGMFVDHLHASLLGVVRLWTGIVLTSVGEEYYVGAPHRISEINKRLISICPPKVITRTPRKLDERKLWKGSEWQDWLIFYSLVCLKGKLKEKYFEHWALFVSAMNILLQKSIPQESLKKAEVLLIKFVFGLQNIYGEEYMNYVVHLHLHMCEGVSNWGPIWAHSTFAFEGQNRLLLNLKHSPARLIPQMSQRFLSFQKICSFPEITRISPIVKSFCSVLLDKNLKFFSRIDDCVLIGSGKNHTLSGRELLSIGHNVQNCLSYDKIIRGGVRYVTLAYHQKYCKKANDSVVLLRSGQIGTILKIYKIYFGEREEIILFVDVFEIDQDPFLSTPDVTIDHIKKCKTIDDVRIYRPVDMLRPCLYAKIEQSEYVILIPYGCYGD